MAGKTKKIDREFLITDSSVNCYGFRLLTEGYMIDEFKRNPIGYLNHDRDKGVIVKWEELRIAGDKVFGKPVVNLSNEKGQQLVEEIENGFINGASVGHIVALEWSEDPKDMVQGQTGPTITKWFNREASPCDIPGNYNALALNAVGLFDKNGNTLNLSDLKSQIPNMKQIILTADQLTLLNLKADDAAEKIQTTLKDLVEKAGKVDQLTADLTAANTAKKKAEDDLTQYKTTAEDAEVVALADGAVKDTKCTKEAGEMLKTQFKGKPKELKALIDTMKPYTPLSSTTTPAGSETEVAELMKLTGEQLFAQGKFDRLKELNAEGFKVKYKDYFKADPPAEEKK